MSKKQSSSQNVNPTVRLEPTPDHLRLDRARFDAALQSRRALGNGVASQSLQSIRDLDEYCANRDRPPKDWIEAPATAEPTMGSAATGDPMEMWKARERAYQRANCDQKVDEFLQQVHEGHAPQGKKTRKAEEAAWSLQKGPDHSWLTYTGETFQEDAQFQSQSDLYDDYLKGIKQNRERNIEKRRMWLSGPNMPPEIRKQLASGAAAALTIIFREIKSKGRCDLSVRQIGKRCGCSDSTVRNAKRFAEKQGWIKQTKRPQHKRISLTTIIVIASAKLYDWIRRGPIGQARGLKNPQTLKNIESFFFRPCLDEDVKSSVKTHLDATYPAALCLDSG